MSILPVSPASAVGRGWLLVVACLGGLAVGILAAWSLLALAVTLASVGALAMLASHNLASTLLAAVIPLSQVISDGELRVAVLLLTVALAGVSGTLHRDWSATARHTVAWLSLLLVSYLSASMVIGDLTVPTGTWAWANLVVLAVPFLLVPMATNSVSRPGWLLGVFLASSTAVALWYVVFARNLLATAEGGWTAVSIDAANFNPNAFSSLVLVALAVALALRSGPLSPWIAVATLFAAAALALALAYSFSRSTYVAALVVLTVDALRRSAPWLATSCAALAVGVQLLPTAVLDRVAYTFGSGRLDASSAVRLDLWRVAARLFADHPIWGVGFQRFSDQLPGYWVPHFSAGYVDLPVYAFTYSHNFYLTVLAELGVAGGVLIGGLVFAAIRAAKAGMRSEQQWVGWAATYTLVGVGVVSMFGEPLFTPNVLAAVLLVLSPNFALASHG